MATKLYLRNSASSPLGISPSTDAAWEATLSTGLVRAYTSTTKSSDTLTTVTNDDANVNDQDVVFRQYIAPLKAGQTVTGSQALKFQIRASEPNANNNLFTAIGIRIIANDGTTVRKTVLAVNRDATEIALTTLTNRQWTGTSAATNYTTVDGDYLVIEIGVAGDPTGSNQQHDSSLRLGDSAGADLAEDDTSTTDNNPWVQLTDTLVLENSMTVANISGTTLNAPSCAYEVTTSTISAGTVLSAQTVAFGTITPPLISTTSIGGPTKIWITTSFTDDFPGSSLDSNNWAAVTAGSGAVTVTDSYAQFSSPAGADAAFIYYKNPIDRNVSQMILATISASALSNEEIRLMDFSGTPTADTGSNQNGRTLLRLQFNSSPAGLSLRYYDSGGTQTFWDGSTWTTTNSAVGVATTDDYYVFGIEIDGDNGNSRWRSFIAHSTTASGFSIDQGLRIFALSDWVNWSSTRTLSNSLYLCIGDSLNDAVAGTSKLEFVRFANGLKQFAWFNGRPTSSGADYDVFETHSYDGKFFILKDRSTTGVVSLVKDPFVIWNPDTKKYDMYAKALSGNANATGGDLIRYDAPTVDGTWTYRNTIAAISGNIRYAFPTVVYTPWDTYPWQILVNKSDVSIPQSWVQWYTATDAAGTWTDRGTVIANGGVGSGENLHVLPGAILQRNGHYEVWYSAREGLGTNMETGMWRATGDTLGSLSKDGSGARIVSADVVEALTANLDGNTVTVSSNSGFEVNSLVWVRNASGGTDDWAESRVRKLASGQIELHHRMNGFTTADSAKIYGAKQLRHQVREVRRVGNEWWIYTTLWNFGTIDNSSVFQEESGLFIVPNGTDLESININHLSLIDCPVSLRGSWGCIGSMENLSLLHTEITEKNVLTALISGTALSTPTVSSGGADQAVTGAFISAGTSINPPTVAYEVTNPLISATSVFAPTTAYAVTTPLISTTALFAPSTALNVTGAFISSGSALFSPTCAYAVTTPLISTTAITQPTVAYAVTTSFIPSGSALFAPTCAYAVTTPSISGTVLYEPTVSASGALSLPVISTTVLFAPLGPFLVVTPALATTVISAPSTAYAVTGTFISSGSALFAPTCAYAVTGAFKSSGLTMFAPSVAYAVTTAFKSSGLTLSAPTVVLGSAQLTLPLISSTVLFGPAVSGGINPIGGNLLLLMFRLNLEGGSGVQELNTGHVASTQVFTPTVGSNLLLPLISAGQRFAPACAYAITNSVINSTTLAPPTVSGGIVSQGGNLLFMLFGLNLGPASGQNVTAPGIQNSAIFAPTVAQTVTNPVIAGTALFTPSLSNVSGLLPPAIGTSLQMFAPTMAYRITTAFASTTALNAPSIAHALSLPTIPSGSATFAPSVAQTLQLPFIASTVALFAPSVTFTNAVTTPSISATALFPQSLQTGTDIVMPTRGSALQMFAPSLTVDPLLALPTISATTVLFAQTLTSANTIALPFIQLTQFYTPAATYAVTTAFKASGTQLFGLQLGAGLVLPAIEATALFTPALDLSIIAAALPAGSLLFGPTLAADQIVSMPHMQTTTTPWPMVVKQINPDLEFNSQIVTSIRFIVNLMHRIRFSSDIT